MLVLIIAPSAGLKIKADQQNQGRISAPGRHGIQRAPRGAWLLAAALCLAAMVPPGIVAAQETATSPVEAAAQLDFIADLYAQGDGFRAESEILRFLAQHPRHPMRPAVEVARAKLYYRRGHPSHSSLMLFSLRDRTTDAALPPDTLRLLVFSLVREGRLDEAASLGEAAGLPPGAVHTLRAPPPGAVDGGSAVRWSTVLPGSGFHVLGQTGRGMAALGLNLVFIGGAVAAWQQDNPGAALALLLVELALYRGGREAVREEAARINARLLGEQRDTWLAMHGEAAVLAAAFSGARRRPEGAAEN